MTRLFDSLTISIFCMAGVWIANGLLLMFGRHLCDTPSEAFAGAGILLVLGCLVALAHGYYIVKRDSP